MDEVKVEQLTYQMPPQEGFTVAAARSRSTAAKRKSPHSTITAAISPRAIGSNVVPSPRTRRS